MNSFLFSNKLFATPLWRRSHNCGFPARRLAVQKLGLHIRALDMCPGMHSSFAIDVVNEVSPYNLWPYLCGLQIVSPILFSTYNCVVDVTPLCIGHCGSLVMASQQCLSSIQLLCKSDVVSSATSYKKVLLMLIT